MSYRLNANAKRMLVKVAGADEVGDAEVSFNMICIPLSSKACKELNEQANEWASGAMSASREGS
ncbi:hypothetical protein [Cupriavidus sp. TMH.W2]|uniref:hypothetical protein n=1 Tax=Cupriavidus sp. TMH.W2 TaxID=3434465 RepID=UPI003D76A9EA